MRNLFILLCCFLSLTVYEVPSFSAEPNLTFYVPFDSGIDAEIAKGKARGTYAKGDAPQFTEGVSGKAFITGGSQQRVIFDAASNISSEQWTITFWMKGLPGATWNKPGFLQTFWTLDGTDGFMWLYKYTDQSQPMLFSKIGQHHPKVLYAPKAAEEDWHFWSVVWRKGAGAYLFLDGSLIGRSNGVPPSDVKHIGVGQIANPAEQNKIIDEFKIYDKAMSAGSIAQRYRAEGKNILGSALPKNTVNANEATGQLELWIYPSLDKIRLGWEILNVSDNEALSVSAVLKDDKKKTVQNIDIKGVSDFYGTKTIETKSIKDGNYTLEAKVLNAQKKTIFQRVLNYEKKPLPEWFGNKLGLSDKPPTPWTGLTLNQQEDTISIWGRSYDYGTRILPSQIINQGKQMLSAPMKIVAKTSQNKENSDASKVEVKWTEETAMRATSLREQTRGDIKLSANSYTEFDGMTWLDLTVSPRGQSAQLSTLTFEIPLKAEWAELIKPFDDYLALQAGRLPKSGWQGKALSMPWIGNNEGGIQFFLESAASWRGSKNVEIVPDGNGNFVLRAHLIDVATMLDKPLQFSFGWSVSPVKPVRKDHRDWRLIPQWRYIRVKDVAFESNFMQQYDHNARVLNPNLTIYFPWWQDWWWLPVKNYKGNYDLTGTVPVPANDAVKNGVVNYAGTKQYASFYGRLSEMGTANPWFKQFGDEWVTDTSKYADNVSLPIEQQKTEVSQASQSLNDFYAWGYNQLIEAGKAHSLYFDLSTPVSDSNIYRGGGTQMPDGTIEPTRNILGLRRIFQRIYTMLKAKHLDGVVIYHMSGEVMLPIESFTDLLADGENFATQLDRDKNRGYENFLSLDKFRAEYAPQHNRGPAGSLIPQFERMQVINLDEWPTVGYHHQDYLMGLMLLHDSHIWWEGLPDAYWTTFFNALESTGRNADWTFIPYWKQKYVTLPDGISASIYRAPNAEKALLVIMNTSDATQEIDVPMTLGEDVFTTAKMIYPAQPIQTQGNTINTLSLGNNEFRAVLLEK